MASKSSILSIVAWSLVVILLIGVGAMAFFESETGGPGRCHAGSFCSRWGRRREWKNFPQIPWSARKRWSAMVQQLEGAIMGDKQELVTTKDALTAAQSDASSALAEVNSLNQGAEELKAKADELSKELAAKGEELDEAKAKAEEAEKAMEKAEKSADKKIAKLEKKADSLKEAMEEKTGMLQADLDAALARIAELESGDSTPVVEEEMDEAMADEEAAAGAEAVEAEVVEAEEVDEPVAVEEEIPEDVGRVIGQSKMFSFIRYSPKSETLFLRLLDGQTLNYQGVPADVVDNLVTAEENLDMKYRFKVQGVYKSLPPDSVVIRKYWKNEKYSPVPQDVRLLEDEPLPSMDGDEVVMEEDVVVEGEAVAEEE